MIKWKHFTSTSVSISIPVSILLFSCLVLSKPLWPHGLWPTKALCPWNSPGKNTGVGCHFLLQGIFLTQGSNMHLLHWQAESLLLGHQRSLYTHTHTHTHKYIYSMRRQMVMVLSCLHCHLTKTLERYNKITQQNKTITSTLIRELPRTISLLWHSPSLSFSGIYSYLPWLHLRGALSELATRCIRGK